MLILKNYNWFMSKIIGTLTKYLKSNSNVCGTYKKIIFFVLLSKRKYYLYLFYQARETIFAFV